MDLLSARLVLIHLHPHQLHQPYILQQQLLEPRVGNYQATFNLLPFIPVTAPLQLLVTDTFNIMKSLLDTTKSN
jgi:hypothetical protein